MTLASMAIRRQEYETFKEHSGAWGAAASPVFEENVFEDDEPSSPELKELTDFLETAASSPVFEENAFEDAFGPSSPLGPDADDGLSRCWRALSLIDSMTTDGGYDRGLAADMAVLSAKQELQEAEESEEWLHETLVADIAADDAARVPLVLREDGSPDMRMRGTARRGQPEYVRKRVPGTEKFTVLAAHADGGGPGDSSDDESEGEGEGEGEGGGGGGQMWAGSLGGGEGGGEGGGRAGHHMWAGLGAPLGVATSSDSGCTTSHDDY